MRLLGLLLLVFGVGTTVLYFMETSVSWLDWVGNWGPEVAWGIRGGSAVLGLVLMAAGKKKDGKKK
jgi:hypothetical protein